MGARFTLEQLPPALREQALRQLQAEHYGKGRAAGAGDAGTPADSVSVGSTAAEAVANVSVVGPAWKTRKYRNEPVQAYGYAFDSRHEMQRFETLRGMQTSGLITDLRVHPMYPLNAPNGELVGYYEADFDYRQNGVLVVEDCKAPPTAQQALYEWKRKHFRAQYGFDIREIFRRRRGRKQTHDGT